MKNGLLPILIGASLLACGPVQAQPSGDPNNTYLDQLLGNWTITGTGMGKPVKYALRGERVLKGGFVRLNMIDTKVPPEYQADIYIGYDRKARDYVAHWLDQFGAAGARVVATGHRDGERLVLIFPYDEGAFRDTFSYDPASKRWHWLLEQQGTNGNWSTFADYTITRK